MTDWTHEGLPPFGSVADVWQGGTSVRRVSTDGNGLRYVDCTHPMQNVTCDPDGILAWRLVDGMIQPPPTQGMIADNEAMNFWAMVFGPNASSF